jgi:hypothetical protein
MMNRKLQNLALLLGALIVLANAPAFADRAPDWMVGRYESDTRSGGKIISLRVNRQGSLRGDIRGGGPNVISITASYHRGIFDIDDRDYTVVRTGDGFRAVPDRHRSHQGNARNRQDNDRFAQIFFHRIDDRDRKRSR